MLDFSFTLLYVGEMNYSYRLYATEGGGETKYHIVKFHPRWRAAPQK